jgi:Ca2+-transporting ATPase
MDKKRQGLSAAEVLVSREEHGQNVLTPPKRPSMWRLYLEKYEDPMVRILLVAAVVSLMLAFVKQDFLETVGIIAAVVLATTVGFYFERDAARKFDVLTQLGEEQPVKVIRDGRVMEIPRRDVVVGDIVMVETGDEIPADGKLLEAIDLQVDESSLTGEAMTNKEVRCKMEDGRCSDISPQPSDIRGEEAYPKDMLLRSSMVMSGSGLYVVTAVGDETEIGHVARQSTEITGVKTPLNIQLDRLAKLISKVGIGLSAAAFVVFLVHDILTDELWHTTDYVSMTEVVLKYFMMAVTLIVMAVPEGLPMAVTLALALNMRRMLKSNNLVRKLQASETMGAVTCICTDKTGTLTENRMTVSDVRCLMSDGGGSALSLQPSDLYNAIALNTTATHDVGNPTEQALLRWLVAQGVDYQQLREAHPITAREPFSTERKYMSTTVGDTIYIKGAPEIVMAMCEMTDEERQQAEQQLAEWQQHAMRTLAIAVGSRFTVHGLRLLAIVAISDPLRKEVPSAIRQCGQAGIDVKIVTGDTTATAMEIAQQCGIIEVRGERLEVRDKAYITGVEFAALSDEDALQMVKSLKVMSRARPTDKQRLVALLQQRGEVVAVTGDGTNDAPALNRAHVGLSLGSGTSVAKEASDITLIDDSFRSIVHAVMWGRSLYKNIQRFIFFQLVVNVTALLLVLCGAFVGTEMPLTITQILWVNLIMDTFAAMALASLPPSREVMRERPRSQDAFIITRPMIRGIGIIGGLFFVVTFALLYYFERIAGVDPKELTIFFCIFVMLQWWNLFNARSLGSCHSAFRRLWACRGFLFVLAMVLAGQWLIVTFGGKMFRTVPLEWPCWGWIILGTSPVLWVGEVYRLIVRMRKA